MGKVEFNFYNNLQLNGRAPNKVPKSVSSSSEFRMLLEAKIINKVHSGRGYYYEVSKQDKFEVFYTKKYPRDDIEVMTEVDNQLKYRDTKATALKKDRVIFIRGTQKITLNGKELDLKHATQEFNIFSAVFQTLQTKKICFVENLQPFLEVEKILGDEYTYIHFYGRLPRKEVLSNIECDEYLHFGDYDFLGLNEFLKAKEVFDNCEIYIPDNYDKLYNEFSRKREAKDTAYEKVKNSTISEVVRIREQLSKHNRYLEQQVVIGEIV